MECVFLSSKTALTNCGATLIAEDHPVPVLTQYVDCRQLQSGKEYDTPPQRNRHHDHHLVSLSEELFGSWLLIFVNSTDLSANIEMAMLPILLPPQPASPHCPQP